MGSRSRQHFGCHRVSATCISGYLAVAACFLGAFPVAGAQESESEALKLLSGLPAYLQKHLGWFHDDDILSSLRAPRHLHWTEMFCGSGRLSSALARSLSASRGRSHDKNLGDDILSTAGFCVHIMTILAVVRYGLAWFGTPCSTHKSNHLVRELKITKCVNSMSIKMHNST